jgi:hypothetical protein
MDLEKGAAHLKPRGAYEAVDFGFLFVREHYFQLLATAALLVLPIASLLALVLPGYLAWTSFFLWWCKPVWERALLFMLSRSLFEDRPSIRATLRSFSEYSFRDWLPVLTIRRLSPTRSFDLPVTVLEGSTGTARAERLRILHRGRFPTAAMALTILLAHVELGIVLGILVLIQILTPDAVDWNVFKWVLDTDGSMMSRAFGFYTGLVAMLLVSPFYVAGGFSLYLHRRTELEAWDLELAFRRLASRAIRGRGTRPTATLATLILSIGVAMGGLGSGIGEARAEEIAPDQARASIELILAGEAFHRVETIEIPRLLLDWEIDHDEQEGDGIPLWLVDFIDRVAAIVGGGLEVLLVSLGIGCLALIGLRVAQQRGLFAASPKPDRIRRVAPTELFGLELTEESLPDDLVAEARRTAAAGNARAALALLYRGALVRLAALNGLKLSKGVTERECLESVRSLIPGEGSLYFDRLTMTWLRCAYGHIEPDDQGLERLCREWPRFFDEQSKLASSIAGAASDEP